MIKRVSHKRWQFAQQNELEYQKQKAIQLSTAMQSIDTLARSNSESVSAYYPPAAIRVHESVSPPVKNKSHELIAELDLPEDNRDGMLVTAGGRTAGYGLFIKDNRLTYVYNYIGIDRTVLISSEEVPPGESVVSMKFTKTGDFEGDAEIFIDGRSVGKARLDKTVPATFSIEETFDVGEDTGSPIIEDTYAVPFRSAGLKKLTVRVDHPK